MALEWISLEVTGPFDGPDMRKSSLLIDGDGLSVVGALRHYETIRPASREDAQRLRAWLDRHYPAPGSIVRKVRRRD